MNYKKNTIRLQINYNKIMFRLLYYSNILNTTQIERFIYSIQQEYKYHTRVMEIEILNVRLPKEITDWLDSLVAKSLYKSRSEAIREFSREYIAKHKGDSHA